MNQKVSTSLSQTHLLVFFKRTPLLVQNSQKFRLIFLFLKKKNHSITKNVFFSIFCWLLRVGEESGNLINSSQHFKELNSILRLKPFWLIMILIAPLNVAFEANKVEFDFDGPSKFTVADSAPFFSLFVRKKSWICLDETF